MNLNPLLVEALGSIVRAGLAVLAGYVVSAGIWTPEDASKYVAAAALALIVLGWSLWQKYASRLTLVTALASPQPMTETQARAKSDSVFAPSATTPADEVPKSRE